MGLSAQQMKHENAGTYRPIFRPDFQTTHKNVVAAISLWATSAVNGPLTSVRPKTSPKEEWMLHLRDGAVMAVRRGMYSLSLMKSPLSVSPP